MNKNSNIYCQLFKTNKVLFTKKKKKKAHNLIVILLGVAV